MHSHLFLLSTSNYMILDFSFDFNDFSNESFQKIYNDSVNLHLSAYTCPNPDCLNDHTQLTISTSYMRYIYLDCDFLISVFIIVLRCPVCGAYHSVLPVQLLPFSSFSYPFIMKTLFIYFFGQNKGNKSQACNDMHISRKTLEHFLSAFSFEFVRSLHRKKVYNLCNTLIRLHHDPTPLFPFLFNYLSDGMVFLTAHIHRAFCFSLLHPPNNRAK